MNIKQLILVILIGIQLKANAQQKVSLVLNDADFNDVMIGESSPNTNFSPYQLAIGTRLMGKSELRRTLMKFDLSSFAPGSILDSAVLILYEDNESIIIGSYEQSFEIFRNTSPWNGSLVTWNTKPSRIDSGFIENTGLKFNSSNLTELISFFINNPDSNFGFQICIPNEGVDTPYKKIVFYPQVEIKLHFVQRLSCTFAII